MTRLKSCINYFFHFQADEMKLDSLVNKSKCFQSQYESYVKEVYDVNVNGSKSSSQNIGDFLSFYLSHNAYKSWQKSTSEQPPRLPGLFFTPEQFFWISSAQRHCSIDRDIAVVKRKILTEFPIHQFRVVNSLRNNEDFSRDFNCPEGSSMNAASKC